MLNGSACWGHPLEWFHFSCCQITLSWAHDATSFPIKLCIIHFYSVVDPVASCIGLIYVLSKLFRRRHTCRRGSPELQWETKIYDSVGGLPLKSYHFFPSLYCFSPLCHSIITFSFLWCVCSKATYTFPEMSVRVNPRDTLLFFFLSVFYFPLSSFLRSPDASSQGWSTEPLADVGSWV